MTAPDMTAATGTVTKAKPARRPARKLVRGWLVMVALMIMAMVVVGGATRLTHSGLSITSWKPIHGVIPPLNTEQWQEEFSAYQQIPEYKELNQGMTLAGFQSIYWWEYAHRLLARAIGVVVLLPLIFFWATGRLEPALKPRVVVLFLLGALQGAVGWWMVSSGLAVRTDVSQYRLATHLTLACIILAYTWWTVRGLSTRTIASRASLRAVALLIVAIAFVQIFLGGLVAGLDAGMSYNTWPLMDGTIVPKGLFLMQPWWRNLFEAPATAQFDHRMGAYTLWIVVLLHAWQCRTYPQARSAWLLAALVTAQAILGISTLLNMVPLPLALAHQFGAVVVLSVAVVHLRGMLPVLPSAEVEGPTAVPRVSSTPQLPAGRASG
jgi:cytochrome c oxidase assembly protein subunit 15